MKLCLAISTTPQHTMGAVVLHYRRAVNWMSSFSIAISKLPAE